MLKPGNVICTIENYNYLFSDIDRTNLICNIPSKTKLIILSEVIETKKVTVCISSLEEDYLFFIKVLYENKVGYISWPSKRKTFKEIKK